MANLIRLKRASGSDPAASDLVSGEPAVRTDTGELFFKKDDGSVAKVSGAGGGPDFKYLALRNAANNGAASYPNADFTLVTSGTTTALTPTAANTLLVSVNGVIQKPNTGTSTPSSGFALSGSTIKFGANISAAPDFILYQESGGIGEPSDATVSEAKLNVSNSPVNGYFLSAQSGNTGGLTWAAPVATSCTGNSATATALATARAINGVNFDGTAAITVTAAAGTLSGNTLNSSVTASSLTSLGDLTSLTVTGDLVVDTSTLKVDSSNNRVGIGTTSPATRFAVKSAGANSNQITLVDHDSTNEVFRVGQQSDGDGFLQLVQDEGTVGVSFDASGVSHISGGNVGIGTTSPSFKLHVDGTSRFGSTRINSTTESTDGAFNDLVIGDYSSNRGISILSGATGQGAVGFAKSGTTADGYLAYVHNGTATSSAMTLKSQGHIKFNAGSSTKLYIEHDGNVGIGTTSPSTKLHVNGTVTATAYAGDGSALTGISAGATGGGSDEVFYENSTTVTTSYSITSNKNAMSAGPLSINSGAVVTIPSGSVWTIV